ncbi:Hypothetical protein D9617_6g093730 [Elsinoe fawcettii]|nr:Hypothetical protein D9617_6g093730 [Elsinoe fawcettii]
MRLTFTVVTLTVLWRLGLAEPLLKGHIEHASRGDVIEIPSLSERWVQHVVQKRALLPDAQQSPQSSRSQLAVPPSMKQPSRQASQGTTPLGVGTQSSLWRASGSNPGSQASGSQGNANIRGDPVSRPSSTNLPSAPAATSLPQAGNSGTSDVQAGASQRAAPNTSASGSSGTSAGPSSSTSSGGIKPVWLLKFQPAPRQRHHFAIFIPYKSCAGADPRASGATCKGTQIHVVGTPMGGFIHEFKRDFDCTASNSCVKAVRLGDMDAALADEHNGGYVKEDRPRSQIDRLALTVQPPRGGQVATEPVDGDKNRRCQEWTMDFLAAVVRKGWLTQRAVDAAQAERDPPEFGVGLRPVNPRPARL